jgi:hypothetical protein
MATIKVRQNGPYLVDGGEVTLVDWNGATYQIAKRVDDQAVLRRHALEDRLPGRGGGGPGQFRQTGSIDLVIG